MTLHKYRTFEERRDEQLKRTIHAWRQHRVMWLMIVVIQARRIFV